MSQRKKLIIGVLGLLAVTILFYGISRTGSEFERFNITEIEENGTTLTCELYTERCTCYGSLTVMESYPPQYDCDGYLRCEPIDRRDCRPQQ